MTLIELYNMADRANIDVDSFRFDKIDALSILDEFGDCHIAIDPFKLESQADEKAKLGHEMGHCMTGSFYNKDNIYDLKGKQESRADRWMIKKLIPYDELLNACRQGSGTAYELAEYFSLPQATIEKAIRFYKDVENKDFI